MTSLWACPNPRITYMLLVFLCSSWCHISEKCGEGGIIRLTLPNSGKFDSWTQTRNTALNPKSYSIFVFALCSVSASLWPALLTGTVKDRTWVICLGLHTLFSPFLPLSPPSPWLFEACVLPVSLISLAQNSGFIHREPLFSSCSSTWAHFDMRAGVIDLRFQVAF